MSRDIMKKILREQLYEELLDISDMMKAKTHNLEQILTFAVSQVLKNTNAERCFVVLLEREGKLNFIIKQQRNGLEITNTDDTISQSILREVIETGNPLVLPNAITDYRFYQARSVMYNRLRSVMCVPLTIGPRIVGAIYVENRSARDQFTQDDIIPLKLMADQTAEAIEKACLFEQTNSKTAEFSWETDL